MSQVTESLTSVSPEMQALKSRLKTTWMSGDYGHFARYLEPGALAFLQRLQLQPGTRLLDVACGAGQIAIPAARAGVQVTGVDIAANLVAQARTRAATEGVPVRFDEGDAEDLPYADAAFDVVVSLIGAMFAPRPERVAAELLRVCRPGGRIVMANWTPQGFVGQMFKTLAGHVPPPPLMTPPVQWGDETKVRERLGEGVSQLDMSRRMYDLRYPFGPEQVVDFFIDYYGPTNRAHASLGADGQAALRKDLTALWNQANRARDGGTQVAAEYLEVQARRA